jgi:1-acyl-sn-glycerol-3-phosphate acyltransferase
VTEQNKEYGRVHGYARLALFGLVLLWVGLKMLVQRPRTLADRSLWRQRMCLLIARCIGLEIDVIGRVPATGMVVSNHLSYLDAVVLGALWPAVFVAKAEVRTWPLVGWLTAKGGTIYLQRENVRAAAEVNRSLAVAIKEDLPVVVFPEGTTTGATDPLPFHPALFDPALRSDIPVWPTALAYTINGGSEGVAEDVCYWGDMTFMPHIVRLMRVPNLRAVVRVSDDPVFADTRAAAASMSHSVVASMLHEGLERPLHVAAARPVGGHKTSPMQPLQN